MLEEPELWGVEQLGANGVMLRLVVKTTPSQQWRVSRELRERIKVAFDEEGIEIPFPQQTVWHKTRRSRRAEMDDAEDRISWFPVPDEADLPPELQGLFRAARERIGFVPNVFRTYAFRPERLSAWFAHFRMLHEETPGLSAAEREMIAVVVSMANGCLYCLVAHGAALREAWGDPVMADRITLDWRRAARSQRPPARDLRDGGAAHAEAAASAPRRSSTSCARTGSPTRTRGTSSRWPRCTTSRTAWRSPPASCRTPSTTRWLAEPPIAQANRLLNGPI